jgi:hypothetical protein
MSSNMGLFPLLARPQPLPVWKTCVYKTVQNGKSTISIPVDIYLPYTRSKDACPIIVYIHGGGWIGGNKTDYSRPLFHEFLSLGFIVTSMDYRLLPETSFKGQQDDIRDIEPWVKRQLQVEIRDSGLKCNTDKIIVAGGSAGAHLALLTVRFFVLSTSVPKTNKISAQVMAHLANGNSIPLRAYRLSHLALARSRPTLLLKDALSALYTYTPSRWY